MEHAAHPSAETAPHDGDHAPHDSGHGDEFYAATNPKFFGLPLGVLIAATVSAVSVGITLFKFFGLTLLGR